MSTKGRKTVATEAIPPGPSHDAIAKRAYEIWLGRGGEPGREVENWLEAERELREASKGRPKAKGRRDRGSHVEA
ncbi:MAG: hypothetical protein A2V74_04030 [Acidobacteria bacterium RBG_16_70_10]|nr:MAG: hypothetical protein A2V74_04030 [Acidobacteria bacterium RBG_16_70_10]